MCDHEENRLTVKKSSEYSCGFWIPENGEGICRGRWGGDDDVESAESPISGIRVAKEHVVTSLGGYVSPLIISKPTFRNPD